jgi:5-(carboxyamino)imidazole ribonucleotide synthase
MEQLVTSQFKLGIIAGGQLGKMLVLAASNWDVQTYVLDADPQCPARSSCTSFQCGDRLNYDDVLAFGTNVDMLTFEIESINIEALHELKRNGLRIYPDPDVLATIQDKGRQKKFFQAMGIPSPAFRLYDDTEAIRQALVSGAITYPFVQKLRHGGYDGRGVEIIRNSSEIDRLLPGPALVEDHVSIEREIAVIVARNDADEVRTFPLVEMEFDPRANLVERLICPSAAPQAIHEQANDLAIRLIRDLPMTGLLAVEMFVDQQGKVWVNEMAPRPHNSGHHTIESIVTSQFEQLLRAIFNFPLGSTRQKLPAVMINLLGEPGFSGRVKYEGLTRSLAIDGVKVHLYGKKETRPFRKMGHVTVLAPTLNEARKRANMVKQHLKVKAWTEHK